MSAAKALPGDTPRVGQPDTPGGEGGASLGAALLAEMTRIRDELMPMYLAIGNPGKPALMLMRIELDQAGKALVDSDIVAMIRCLQSLKEFTG